METSGSPSLADCLAKVLPEGSRFILNHLSSPPTECPAIFAAPPGQKPEETYCEHQFLSVSIEYEGNPLQVFAVEVLIYSTEHLTTLFVSKADSTGYLYLLNLPRTTTSPLKTISTVFLSHLAEGRRRSDRRLVLSLFARAQNQYLFSGSVENPRKHVLDDRGLVKWWCHVVDPILGAHERQNEEWAAKPKATVDGGIARPCQGFLRVPGYSAYETKVFFPKEDLENIAEMNRWKVGDPLQELGQSIGLPERCIIPRFPDDPKARFLDTLDEEIPDESATEFQSQDISSLSASAGRWRSVKSLDQFWEMMSFRQECSSGRLVGFLWAVFTPPDVRGDPNVVPEQPPNIDSVTHGTPLDAEDQETDRIPPGALLRPSPVFEVHSTPPLLPPPSQESPTPSPIKAQETKEIHLQSEQTAHYYWPRSGRGEIVLRQKDYDHVGKLLLRLDYANQVLAQHSTLKWISVVAERARVKEWGRSVLGENKAYAAMKSGDEPTANTLNAGLVRKKKRPAENDSQSAMPLNDAPGVNVLATGLVRKKAKVNTEAAGA